MSCPQALQKSHLTLLRPLGLVRCDILILPLGDPWGEPSLALVSRANGTGFTSLSVHPMDWGLGLDWQGPWHWGLSLQAVLLPGPQHPLHQSLT